MKHGAEEYKTLDTVLVVRLLQPWLIRYSGECRRMVEEIRANPESGKILYGFSGDDERGKYRLVERDVCKRLCGPKALEREERDENDWVNF